MTVPSVASRAGWEHFPQVKAAVLAVMTDKLDLKADTSAVVVGFNFDPLARAEIIGAIQKVTEKAPAAIYGVRDNYYRDTAVEVVGRFL